MTLRALRVSIDDDTGATSTITFDGDCWSLDAVDVFAAFDPCRPPADERAQTDAADGRLFTALRSVFTDYVDPGFTVEQVDGRWFVSPLATSLQHLVTVARALDRDEVELLAPMVGVLASVLAR